MQERARSASPQTTRLHVGHLTRNVTEAHVREIFTTYGKIKAVELVMDGRVNLPRGFAYVEYESRAEAEKAREHMDGGQIDGNVITWVYLRCWLLWGCCVPVRAWCWCMHAELQCTGQQCAPVGLLGMQLCMQGSFCRADCPSSHAMCLCSASQC